MRDRKDRGRQLWSTAWRLALGIVVPVLGALMACTYDPNNRCDQNEQLYGDGIKCVCVKGAAMTATGCVMCGENQVPGDGGCACAPGYAPTADGGSCVAVPAGLGVACGGDGGSCADPTYNHCEGADAGAGYCTNTGCASSSDCANGYGCSTAESPSVCLRPPSGMGQSCMTNADCAGTQATYCDTFVSHQCLVQGCTVTPNDCFVGWQCCDLSGFGVPQPICVPMGACQQ